jgi:hypothetical protein
MEGKRCRWRDRRERNRRRDILETDWVRQRRTESTTGNKEYEGNQEHKRKTEHKKARSTRARTQKRKINEGPKKVLAQLC